MAVKVDFQSVPMGYKNLFWEGCLKGAKNSQSGKFGLSPMLDHNLKTLKSYVFEVKQFSIAMKIDKPNRSLVFDSELIGADGSKIGIDASKNTNMESTRFAGFRRDQNCGLSLGACSNTWSDEIRAFRDDVMQIIEQSMDGESFDFEAEPLTILQELEATLEATLESERFDIGANLMFVDGRPNFLMGTYVADTQRLEAVLQMCFRQIEKSKAPTQFRQSFAEHRGVVFHELVAENDNANEFTAALGSPIKIIIGLGNQSLYFGLGDKSFDALRQCIDDSAEPTVNDQLHSHLQFRMLPWFDLFDESFRDFAKSMMRKATGNDKLVIESRAIENGYRNHVELDLGLIISALGSIQAIGAYSEQEFEEIKAALEAE